MQTEFISITEYCNNYQVEPSFIGSLEEGGLIEIIIINQEKAIPNTQLFELEKYTRWHYDLHINIEGIDAIRHLLERVNAMKNEIENLKTKVSLYESF